MGAHPKKKTYNNSKMNKGGRETRALTLIVRVQSIIRGFLARRAYKKMKFLKRTGCVDIT